MLTCCFECVWPWRYLSIGNIWVTILHQRCARFFFWKGEIIHSYFLRQYCNQILTPAKKFSQWKWIETLLEISTANIFQLIKPKQVEKLEQHWTSIETNEIFFDLCFLYIMLELIGLLLWPRAKLLRCCGSWNSYEQKLIQTVINFN